MDDLFETMSISILALSEGQGCLDSWSRFDLLLTLVFVAALTLLLSEPLAETSVANIKERSSAALRRSIP